MVGLTEGNLLGWKDGTLLGKILGVEVVNGIDDGLLVCIAIGPILGRTDGITLV